MEVHKKTSEHLPALACRWEVPEGWQWSYKWDDVTCDRCLKHRPKKREASDGK